MRVVLAANFLLALAPPVGAREEKPSPTIQVPYRLTNTNHVLLRVKINGKGPYNFILDTGAPALFVSTALAKKLGVAPGRGGWGTFERFEIEGGVVLKDAKGRIEDPFQLEGMNGLGLAGAELHGIIGYTVLARFRLEFDFARHKMGWIPLDFNPPPPEGLGPQVAPGGLGAIGGAMKLLGGVLGKNADQETILRGFVGIVLERDKGTPVVREVLAGTPAAAAGLKPGDTIREINNRRVGTVADLMRMLGRFSGGEMVRLTVGRDQPVTLRLTLGEGF